MRERWINDGGDRDRIFNLLATFLLRERGVRVCVGGGGGDEGFQVHSIKII